MQEYCEQNGIDFCFTIAPNKNSMYSSQMPARYAAASVRNAQLLKQQMEQQNVRYIDLFEVLSNSKEQLYYRLDSHWNMRGAQLAAQALLEELKGCEVEFDPFVAGKKLPHTGDLYEMVYPAGSETEQDTAYDFTYQYDEKFHSADDITIHTKILRQTAVFLFTGILLVSICILSWRRATVVPASLGICHTV